MLELALSPPNENSICGTFKPLKKVVISDCSFARRFWTGHFSVAYQSSEARLVLQQLTVVCSCHELLLHLAAGFFPLL